MSTISKYFKILNENVKTDLQNNSESPYKNVLNDIKVIDLNSSNESNDFKTPKPLLKTKPKVLPRKSSRKKPSARRSLNNIKKISSPIKSNTTKVDCNLEHLHMAIALSNSLHDDDKDKMKKPSNKSEANIHSVTLFDKLQQYKFQSGTSTVQPLHRRTFLEKKRGKSKLQYIRPVLLLRTQEDREKILSDKISLILSNNISSRCTREIIQLNPCSKYLQNLYNSEQKLFSKSKCTNENLSCDFYVDALKIDRCSIRCGSLLKNWHNIPGRSISPVPTVTTTDIDDNLQVLNDSKCLSPDLFDSEDEAPQQCSEIIQKSPILKCSFSKKQDSLTQKSNSLCVNVNPQSELSVNSIREKLETSISDEFVENDNGICVFETFSNQSLGMDLIESSSDDSDTKTKNLEMEQQASLKTGVTETFEKIVSLVSNDDTIDYVYKLLEEENEKKNNSFNKPIKFGNEHEGLYSQEINLTCLRSYSDNFFEQSSSTDMHDQNQSMDSNLEASKINCTKDDSVQPEINFSFAKCESFNSTESEESIYISDDEINYSCLHSTPTSAQRKRKLSKQGSFYSLSESDSSGVENDDFDKEQSLLIDYLSTSSSSKESIGDDKSQNVEPVVSIKSKSNDLENTLLYNILSNKVQKSHSEFINKSPSTPKTEVTMKSSNVTPMPDYKDMNTPKIVKELEKFGLKPLKRPRGVQILSYIYESTHPMVNIKCDNVEDDKDKKKRKVDVSEKSVICDHAWISDSVTAISSSTEENADKHSSSSMKIGKNILGHNEEIILERKQSKKISSCMVPLHIAWYNLVKSDPSIQKNILLYEPLQLEDLYRTLKSHGYKYHIQDLLTFLDRKCITIRTEQTSRPRLKKHKKSKTQS